MPPRPGFALSPQEMEELARWYFLHLAQGRYPDDRPKNEDDEELPPLKFGYSRDPGQPYRYGGPLSKLPHPGVRGRAMDVYRLLNDSQELRWGWRDLSDVRDEHESEAHLKDYGEWLKSRGGYVPQGGDRYPGRGKW